MSKVARERTHSLPLPDARQRVERIAKKLAERFGARCHWVNDELHVEHSAVHGVLRVTSAQVSLKADLRFPANLMQGQIEAEIDRLLDRELSSS